MAFDNQTMETLKSALDAAGAKGLRIRFEEKAVREVYARYPTATADKKRSMVDAILMGYLFGAVQMNNFKNSYCGSDLD